MTSNGIIIIVILFVVIVAVAISSASSREYISDKHPVIDEIKRRFGMINPKYAKIPIHIGHKSFTEDKTVITLCIEDPETKKQYSINVLMYVALHELAHCLTKADGKESHGDEFKANFATLLKEAAEKGVYDPSQSIPTTYCGIDSDKH
jgi:hypothetical protein